LSFCWFFQSRSCAAQKPFSPFCARASRASSAAGSARGWNGSGLSFQTTRTLSPYVFEISSSVGMTLLQNGHWKSDHSTIVTSAVAGPLDGESPTGTFHTVLSSSAGFCSRSLGGGAFALFSCESLT